MWNCEFECSRAEQLKKKLRAQDGSGGRADRSAEQEAAHPGVIAVTPITLDMGAEKSPREEPADAAGDRARHDAFL